jgi:hypothetical protein
MHYANAGNIFGSAVASKADAILAGRFAGVISGYCPRNTRNGFGNKSGFVQLANCVFYFHRLAFRSFVRSVTLNTYKHTNSGIRVNNKMQKKDDFF